MNEVESLVTLTAEIVSAHVSHNAVAVSDLPALIANVHAALARLGAAVEPAPVQPPHPAVTIRASIKPAYIVCLEDGKRMKMLKRHLMTEHRMTPAEYRAKWQLPADYPMVASNYASERRDLALSFGLGKGKRIEAPTVVEPIVVPPVTPPAAAPATSRTRKPRLKIAVPKG